MIDSGVAGILMHTRDLYAETNYTAAYEGTRIGLEQYNEPKVIVQT